MAYGRGGYNRSPSCVYVGNLPDDIKEKEIEDIFRQFGRLRSIDVKRGHTTNGTAYAFLEFENPRDAEDAVEKQHGYVFDRSRLRVEFTGERRQKSKREGFSGGPPQRTSHRVMVTNLPYGCAWQALKDHMRVAGDVGYANVEMGRGIVEYAQREGMKNAIEQLDKSELVTYKSSSTIRVRKDDSNGNDFRGAYRRRRSYSRSHSREDYRDKRHDRRRYSRSPLPVEHNHRHRSSHSPKYHEKAKNGTRVASSSRASHDSKRSVESHKSYSLPKSVDSVNAQNDDTKFDSKKCADFDKRSASQRSYRSDKSYGSNSSTGNKYVDSDKFGDTSIEAQKHTEISSGDKDGDKVNAFSLSSQSDNRSID